MKILNGIWLTAVLLTLLGGAAHLQAEWKVNGTPVCAASYNQHLPNLADAVATDMAGGAIVVWMDMRRTGAGIYVQRINEDGDVCWTLDGIPISLRSAYVYPAIISDGSKGAIITWGSGDIYAQRVNSLGDIQWSEDGVIVCSESHYQRFTQLTNNGAGGAIIVWEDARDAPETFIHDIYAQKVDSLGNTLWQIDGVPICTLISKQCSPKIVADGAGGAIIIWDDYRNDNLDVYAQRVDSDGNIQWALNGIPVTTFVCDQRRAEIISDGNGRAIITWYDYRSGRSEIYAQRYDGNGNALWTPDGVKVSTAVYGDKTLPKISSDMFGGAIITWRDMNTPDWSRNIWVQRIDADGTVLWMPDGVLISTLEMNPGGFFEICSDSLGGAVITWDSWRTNEEIDIYDIYAQRVNAAGIIQWNPGCILVRGLNVYDTPHHYPKVITSNPGDAIVVWMDHRLGQYDIYAQKVNSDGSVVTDAQTPPQALELYQNYPNPFNPSTNIRFYLNRAVHVKLCVYNVKGELVSEIIDQHMIEGRKEVNWDAKDNRGHSVASGIYFYRLVAGDFVQTRKMVLLR